MPLGNIRVQLFRPGLAMLDLGFNDEGTQLVVKEVVDGEWFTIELLKAAIKDEITSGQLGFSRMLGGELVGIIEHQTNLGIPDRFETHVRLLLLALLPKVRVVARTKFLRESGSIVFYLNDGDEPFWKDTVRWMGIETENAEIPFPVTI